MALPDVLSKTDDSLGRAKTDAPSPFPVKVDKDHNCDSTEFEQIKTAIMRATTVGLDGWHCPDDFEDLPLNTAVVRWTQLTANGGTITLIDADTAPAEGFGWVAIAVSNAASSQAILAHVGQLARGASNPRFRCRIKVPTTLDSDSKFSIGFADGALASYAMFEVDDSGVWFANTKSVAGTGTGSTAIGGVPLPGDICDLRIEIDSGVEVRFYVNDVLLHTTTGTSVPRAGDILSWLLKMRRVADGGTLLVDWVDVRGER